MLNDTQLGQWQDQGYLNLGPLFNSAELETIAREYDRLVTLDGQTLGNKQEGEFPYRAMLNFRSPALAAFILHPALLEIAAQLLGEDVRLWWDQGINKKPGAGSFIRWHQDNGYEAGQMPAYLTCWLALDDSNRENGGLEIIPGSHREGPLEHIMQGAHAVIDVPLNAPVDAPISSSGVDEARAIPLDAAAGDMLIFSSLLVHQTVGNHTTDRERRAWVMQYCRGDQRNSVTGEQYDNRAWAIRKGTYQTELKAERRLDLRGDRP